MKLWFWIAAGGALGSVLRYGLSVQAAKSFGTLLPWGTILVNILGSFAIGFMFILLQSKVDDSDVLRAFIITGLLGGFTTFSAFSLETLILLTEGAYFRSLLNVLISVVVCVVAAGMGVFIAKQIT